MANSLVKDKATVIGAKIQYDRYCRFQSLVIAEDIVMVSKVIALVCFFLILIPTDTHAWLFGPDNFEECLLEIMKGQDKSMLITAKKACEKKFPFEKKLSGYINIIEINWHMDEEYIYLDILENHGDYVITKYGANFSTKSCDEIVSYSDYSKTMIFYFDKPNQKKTRIKMKDPKKYHCMQTEEIYGKFRK